MTLGAAGDLTLARRVARASGKELWALGFTTVFAPVADVMSGLDGRRSAAVPRCPTRPWSRRSSPRRLVAAAAAGGLSIGFGDGVRLLGGDRAGSGDVVVALDPPYALAGSTATTARIALYGRTPSAFLALVDVRVGADAGGGILPVEVPEVERRGY